MDIVEQTRAQLDKDIEELQSALSKLRAARDALKDSDSDHDEDEDMDTKYRQPQPSTSDLLLNTALGSPQEDDKYDHDDHEFDDWNDTDWVFMRNEEKKRYLDCELDAMKAARELSAKILASTSTTNTSSSRR